MQTRILVPTGVLGMGFDQAALEAGIKRAPDAICVDGGSTDSGPFYLGTATSKYARSTSKADWRRLMLARQQASVPLIIGSCGTCGADATVDWMYEITCELAEELGQSLIIARLYSEQDLSNLKIAFDTGRITALPAAPDLTAASFTSMSHAVALAGAEQIGAALDSGADIILAGRTTDTATIAALPLKRGAHSGAAWHGAKVAECGAFCSTHPGTGVVLVDFDETGFTIEAMAKEASCTPHSVSAHMLYENVDPFILYEPGGHLDVTAARYQALPRGRVRVEGAIWHPTEHYCVKLEATTIGGYQTSMMAILRDGRYVEKAAHWAESLVSFCHQKIQSSMLLLPQDYSLECRLIGLNAALGDLETSASADAHEIGVLVMITAKNQETATDISKIINPYLLHHSLSASEDLPTFAFPYSPAHSERGILHEFALNHVLELESPMAAFRLNISEICFG